MHLRFSSDLVSMRINKYIGIQAKLVVQRGNVMTNDIDSSKGILIVDDDKDVLLSAKMVLKQKFKKVFTENEPHRIKAMLADQLIDLVLLDMNFTMGFTSGKEGLRWLRIIKNNYPSVKIVLMTAYGDVGLAVQAMKEGASDFVLKPWENRALLSTILHALQESSTHHSSPSSFYREEAMLAEVHKDEYRSGIIGKSDSMKRIFQLIDKVGPTDANVLILGENGTGKELIAKAIHKRSNRAKASFVQVDVATIPESLLESELFGHVKGAFTDAKDDRKGYFETASGGSLFLDEIGNISLSAQIKLLTVLQQRQIRPVGSTRIIPVDIRLICATNMPLNQMIVEQKFRQDLLYRINTVEIQLPPLRERTEDIPLLIQHFMTKYSAKYQREHLNITPHLMKQLQQYHWPGNVRELQHQVERSVIMGEMDMLLPTVKPQHTSVSPINNPVNMEEVEKATILKALQNHDGNVSKAAKALGLGRTTLYRKMNKYGI